MLLDLHSHLDSEVLEEFRDGWLDAINRSWSRSLPELAAEARRHYHEIDLTSVPPLLHDTLALVPAVADFVTDAAWEPSSSVRDKLRGALFYFADPGGVIPDHTPRFGFYDDAVVIELALGECQHEWLAWREFDAFRNSHASGAGLTREHWFELRAADYERALQLHFAPDGALAGEALQRLGRETRSYLSTAGQQLFCVH